MQLLYYEYQTICGLDEHYIVQTMSKLDKVQATIPNLSFVNMLDDQGYVEKIKSLVALKKQTNPDAVVLVGIGGSSLGTLAIYRALQPEKKIIDLICLDTIDPLYTQAQLTSIEKLLESGKCIQVVIVTKSGTTLETQINAGLMFALLKKYHATNFIKHVTIITDENSAAWQYSQANNIDCIHIPKDVGGRFSVFSAVGLVPLGITGVDIDELLHGAKIAIKTCLSPNNPAAVSASIRFLQHQQGHLVHDFFVFGPQYKYLGEWYRQLLAESIGKRMTLSGQEAHIGIIPTVSVGTNDLHSLFQLVMAGPDVWFTTFITRETQDTMPATYGFAQQQQHNLSVLQQAFIAGTQTTYQIEKQPYMHYKLHHNLLPSLGILLQTLMIEIVYLASLFQVNPFDQPEIERYKREVMKRL